MPYQWTAERERLMLLLAVSSSDLKPSANTWAAVAALLGDGLSPSAVSQKYYKLRKESVKLCGNNPFLSPPSTPSKRKAPSDDDGTLDKPTPTKRAKPTVKAEDIDGGSFSNSPLTQTDSSFYDQYSVSFMPPTYPSYGMEQLPPKPQDLEGHSFAFENLQN